MATLESPEIIRTRILEAVPDAQVELLETGEPSLLVDCAHLPAVARSIKEDETLRMDLCSNVTGVDYPADDVIEIVYHFYSVELKIGPIILKTRVPREVDKCECPSITPLYRGAELQEREVYDLYGVRFTEHPDLRRILMWDGFEGFPMRKDYVPEDQDILEGSALADRPEDTIN
jgi:NADH-quinone oxidoreductase subunit C